jgi:siroheme synthase
VTARSYAKAVAFATLHNVELDTVITSAIDLLVYAMENKECEKVVEKLGKAAQQYRSGSVSVAPISKTLDDMRKKGALPPRR